MKMRPPAVGAGLVPARPRRDTIVAVTPLPNAWVRPSRCPEPAQAQSSPLRFHQRSDGAPRRVGERAERFH